MTKVRFNLGKGRNFMKWQVKTGKRVRYYDPTQVQLTMIGCRLRNRPKTAQRIYEGENKTICAWVDCKSVTIQPIASHKGRRIIQYNPKVKPYWRSGNNRNIDNCRYETIVSVGRHLFAA